MAVINIKTKNSLVWIPPMSTPQFKLTVETDGVEEDITNQCTNATVEDYATESIGSFSFDILNPIETYTNKWNGHEIFRYYKAYGNNTTLFFRGRIEKPSKQGYKLKVEGRSESLKFMDTLVTKQYSNAQPSVILKDLIDTYATDFSYTNVNDTTLDAGLTVNWYRKPMWECIKELCTASGFDCWVDSDLDFHFFEIGSIDNATDAVVHNSNLAEVDDFSPDITQVRNKIKVSGAINEGIQIFYTAEDTTSQSEYGIREESINDDNITSYAQAVDVGDFELSRLKDPPLVGSVRSIFLLGAYKPGERIRVSAPSEGLPMAYYNGVGYKDELKIQDGELTTTVFLNKEPRKISHVLKDRVEQENSTKSTYINPYDLDASYDFQFDDVITDYSGYSNVNIAGSLLYPTSSGGYWISNVRALSSNVTDAYLILNGTELNNISVQVSGNDGVDYQSIANKEKIVMGTAIGPNLKIKVTFNTVTASLNSLSLQYNVA